MERGRKPTAAATAAVVELAARAADMQKQVLVASAVFGPNCGQFLFNLDTNGYDRSAQNFMATSNQLVYLNSL